MGIFEFIEPEPDLEKMEYLHEIMWLLHYFDYSLDLLSGDWAKSLCWNVGVLLGKKKEKEDKIEKCDDIYCAVKNLDPWKVDVFKKISEKEYLVVFKECPIRQVHYSVCSDQGTSLCQVTHGYFTQILSSSLGKKVKLELLHPGPNACIKRVVIE